MSLLFLLSFLLSGFAHAGDEACVRKAHLLTPSVRIPGEKGAPGERIAQEALEPVARLTTGLRQPRDFKLILSNSNFIQCKGPYYVEETESFYLPESWLGVLDPQFRRFVEDTLGREYGRAVFAASFGAYSKSWARYHYRNTRLRLGRAAAYFPEMAGRPTRLLWLSMPYQALFADLLVVTARRNPLAVAEMLGVFGVEEDGRSFADGLFAARWSHDWSRPQRLLEPSRRYLWETYLADGKNEGREPELVAAVFRLLAEEVIARDADPQADFWSSELMNLRLLRRLSDGLTAFETQQ